MKSNSKLKKKKNESKSSEIYSQQIIQWNNDIGHIVNKT
jgi:hypothetical protein